MKSTTGEKSSDPTSLTLDYRILGIIGGLIIAYQIGLFLTADEPGYNITDTTYLIAIGLVATFGMIVAKRYYRSSVFGNAHILLGLGFVAMLIGDLAFYYYEYILEIDPYPSPFDIAFLVGYVCVITHLVLNTKFFKPKFTIKDKAMLVLIPVLVTSVYVVTALQEWGEYDELTFDIFWGSLFAVGSSTTLAFTVLGVSIFRNSALKEVWLLLVVGIFLWMAADVWYYYLETFEAYYSSHVVNTMWMASFLLIIYALIQHKKVF